jgi:CHAD domain-containing protein
MDFSIDPREAVGDEFRRIAAELLETALEELQTSDPARLPVAVHEARKACKRLRALFRLVRPSLVDRRYRALDAGVRDAARELSSTRDAQALVDMFDALLLAHGLSRPDAALGSVREGLTDRVSGPEWDDAGAAAALRRAGERLEVAREAVAVTKLRLDGFKAMRDGAATTYRQGRHALERLRREASAERSHEWRKAVKYTWHHLELLQRTAPSVLRPAGVSFHQLSDALGDAHNLAVLAELLEGAPARFGGPLAIDPALRMAKSSQAELEGRAIRLGLRLYAEPAKAVAGRLHGYWRAARTVGSELPTGELSDIADVERPAGGESDSGVDAPGEVIAGAGADELVDGEALPAGGFEAGARPRGDLELL